MPVDSTATRPLEPLGASPVAPLVAEVGGQSRSATPQERVFADLCLLAARLLRVPTTIASLRDVDRVIPVGAYGSRDLSMSWGSSPLSISLSSHTASEGAALSISDVRSHALLADDPLHTEAGFLSFLAVPLPIQGESEISGTLCAQSREARTWSDEDVESLSLVARAIANEIRLRGLLLRAHTLERENRIETDKRSRQSPQWFPVARDTEAELRDIEARHRFLADAIPQQIWIALSDGRLEYVNEVVIDYLGVAREAAVDKTWDGWIHYQDVPEWRGRWQSCRDDGRDFEMELRLLDREGAYRWHLVRAKALRLGDDTVSRWYGTNTNIHDLKELERAHDKAHEELEHITHLLSGERTTLQEQAKELRRFALALQRSNRELDQFAYVASHDLKAPLRGIAKLAEWLSEDLEDRLDDRTREYLRLLDARVHRMERLIEGILQYARAGRARTNPESVDVGRLVHEVIDMLAPPTRFKIEVQGYMPVMVTERSPLEQVFLNLLGNAVKHADSESPLVTVSVTDEGGGWFEFSVTDNGPGIAPEFHERIFTIFQTLVPRDDVEGTGIGLSVVKRIVEWQGGQVWVESEVGRGATFRFLWPDSPREVREPAAWRNAR
jgi:PAS domain S-box-containing protein